jgi:hypothetical protein
MQHIAHNENIIAHATHTTLLLAVLMWIHVCTHVCLFALLNVRTYAVTRIRF